MLCWIPHFFLLLPRHWIIIHYYEGIMLCSLHKLYQTFKNHLNYKLIAYNAFLVISVCMYWSTGNIFGKYFIWIIITQYDDINRGKQEKRYFHYAHKAVCIKSLTLPRIDMEEVFSKWWPVLFSTTLLVFHAVARMLTFSSEVLQKKNGWAGA